MSDRGVEDRQDIGEAFTANVLPREQPVSTAENRLSELAFSPVVRQGNVAVIEEDQKSCALSMQVAQGTTECSLRWHECALFVDPSEDGLGVRRALLLPALLALCCIVPGELGFALDVEQRCDESNPVECDAISGASTQHQTSTRVRPTAWTPTSSSLDECQQVGAVDLNGARVVAFSEEPLDAPGACVG